MKQKESEGLIIGKNALREAFAAGKSLQKVFLQDSLENESLTELLKLCRKNKVPVLQVPKSKLDRLTRSQHQGVVAMVKWVAFQDLQDVIDLAYQSGVDPCFLILDRITDVRNFGAIARSAEVFGINGLIIPKKDSAPINQEAIKASAGALLRLPVSQISESQHAVKTLQRNGFRVIACTEKSSASLRENISPGATAFVLGSEGEGISEQVLQFCDATSTIPQLGQISSLNVSVAAGIICYEWMLFQQSKSS
ncbi:MAG: 23S rRNA (guanosine(2251)-2'-O)-methyltransferase RlmB [Saprospiraceae bacterium]|nr:23S rRNA (guanosine(2251)-2'-O)-methyltransferase RlmB [Saprospiraceae bacterium]MBK7795211.1 23S rRNA (guanosine(2251)-2'-O)-methyltransferase RlmB [Saprospiraceae bacterium]MBL0261899.1 23S rRNA (guanosine(2251)-2'-O)-methyltransferase RlmB [Saprospiraceae bacterium]